MMAGRRPSVLMIDDDQDYLNIWSLLLKQQGFEVLTHSESSSAIDVVAAFCPDVILLDLKMPNLNGWQFLKRLEADDRTTGTPVIICSSMIPSGDLAKAYFAGAFDYTSKLVPKEHLSLIIERVIHCSSEEKRAELRRLRAPLLFHPDDYLASLTV